jgi:hypothetical protein
MIHAKKIKIDGTFDQFNGKISPTIDDANMHYAVNNNYQLIPESIVNLDLVPELVYFNDHSYDGSDLIENCDISIQFLN